MAIYLLRENAYQDANKKALYVYNPTAFVNSYAYNTTCPNISNLVNENRFRGIAEYQQYIYVLDGYHSSYLVRFIKISKADYSFVSQKCGLFQNWEYIPDGRGGGYYDWVAHWNIQCGGNDIALEQMRGLAIFGNTLVAIGYVYQAGYTANRGIIQLDTSFNCLGFKNFTTISMTGNVEVWNGTIIIPGTGPVDWGVTTATSINGTWTSRNVNATWRITYIATKNNTGKIYCAIFDGTKFGLAILDPITWTFSVMNTATFTTGGQLSGSTISAISVSDNFLYVVTAGRIVKFNKHTLALEELLTTINAGTVSSMGINIQDTPVPSNAPFSELLLNESLEQTSSGTKSAIEEYNNELYVVNTPGNHYLECVIVGDTITRTVIYNTPVGFRIFDANIVKDANGNMFVIVTESNNTTSSRILLFSYTQSTQTWSGPQYISNETLTDGWHYGAFITTDSNGNLYVVWYRDGAPDYNGEIWFSKYTTSWSTPELLTDPNKSCWNPICIIDADGYLNVFFSDYDEANNIERIATIKYTTSWSDIVYLTPDTERNEYPGVVMTPDGNLHVTYEMYSESWDLVSIGYVERINGVWQTSTTAMNSPEPNTYNYVGIGQKDGVIFLMWGETEYMDPGYEVRVMGADMTEDGWGVPYVMLTETTVNYPYISVSFSEVERSASLVYGEGDYPTPTYSTNIILTYENGGSGSISVPFALLQNMVKGI
jgi:hypothetical protein